MEFDTLIYEKDKKGIVKITINRPEVRNSLNIQARKDLKKAITAINKDRGARVAIITGAGEKAFIAGAAEHSPRRNSVLTGSMS